MKLNRRSFIALCTAGAVTAPRRADTVKRYWTLPGDIDAWAVSSGEIFAVGSRLVVVDPVTGRELRTARLCPPPAAARVLSVTATPTAVVFGWYGWKGEGRIVCADSRSLKARWQRKLPWPDEERELSPGVFAVVRDDAVFVLLSGKRGENLFRLRLDTGETAWSRKIDRFVLGVPLVWRDGRLLVQSRVTQHHPNGHGHYQAIEATTGTTLWQLKFEGMADFWDDPPLVLDDHAYLTTEIRPGPSNHLYVIDVARGVMVSHRPVQALREPFAEHDGIVYFGTDTPAAWDPKSDRVIWRSRLILPNSVAPAIVPNGVLDAARTRIYLGGATDSLYKISSLDGTTIERVDLRTGYVNPARGLNSGYGVRRMQLIDERLVIGTEDGRLVALAVAP